MEKKELIEELNINVGTINEINLKLKEYLEEIEVTFIPLCGGKNTACNAVYVDLYQEFIVLVGGWFTLGHQQWAEFAGKGAKHFPNDPNSDGWQDATWATLDHSTELS